jgi:hypothetical protein
VIDVSRGADNNGFHGRTSIGVRRGRRPRLPGGAKLRSLESDATTAKMHNEFADLTARPRARAKPAGLAPGRPDEGVWAYVIRVGVVGEVGR